MQHRHFGNKNYGVVDLLLIIAAIFGCIVIRNNIVRHHNATIRAWSDVASYERQKVKILDSLQPRSNNIPVLKKGL